MAVYPCPKKVLISIFEEALSKRKKSYLTQKRHRNTKQREKKQRAQEKVRALEKSCQVETNLPFGCQKSDINLIFGGLCGYSLGKYKCALNKPPSLQQTANKKTEWALDKYQER